MLDSMRRSSYLVGNGVVQETIRLEIGCGSVKAEGWVGMDVAPLEGVDIVHDLLDFPWPIADESVSEARALHVIEHVPHRCLCCRNQREPLMAFFDELYRVLVPNGTVFIESPHSSSTRAWQDPTHTRGINQATFAYASRQWREDKRVSHYDIHCNFSLAYNFVLSEDGAIQDIQAQLTKQP